MFENDKVKIWRDENDIIHTTYKGGVKLDESLADKIMSFRDSLHPGFATGHMLDISGLSSINLKARKKTTKNYTPEKYKALAIIIDNPVSWMIAKMISKLHPRKDLNGKTFNNREDAYEWLMQECKTC